MLLKMWQQSITRIRPGTKTERGSMVPDWENVSTLVIEECLVHPGNTMLSQDGRVMGIEDGLTVCAPLESDIKAGDRIQVWDGIYTILGDPLIWRNVKKLDHMQLNLKRWRG